MSPVRSRMGRMVRISRLAEDRAELVLDGARNAEAKAETVVQDARAILDALGQAKSSNAPATGLDIERYRQALLLEEIGAGREAEANQALHACQDATMRAGEALLASHQRLRATETRESRQRRAVEDQLERRAYDEVLDLWSRGSGKRK